MAVKKWLFCDIDHVLSDAFHRDRLISTDHKSVTEPQWEVYHTAAKYDAPIRFMIDIVNGMFDAGFQIVLITARPNWMRSITKDWLFRYSVQYDQLLMRPNVDHPEYCLPSPKLKKIQLVRYIQAMNIPTQDDILLIDDRADICQAMAEIGVQTLQFHYNRNDNAEAKALWKPKAPEDDQAEEVQKVAAE